MILENETQYPQSNSEVSISIGMDHLVSQRCHEKHFLSDVKEVNLPKVYL